MKQFRILHKDGKARVGKLKTAHGEIDTPNFIPAATRGAVKALSPKDLKEIGVQVVLGNTYHLMLKPGEKLIESLGGLHNFMGWKGPIFTDSGGFQVFSLGVALEHGVGKLLYEEDFSPKPRLNEQSSLNSVGRPRLNRITEEGVVFQSHIDGSKHILTPEKSIKIQHDLGSDLMVSFDDLESPKHSYEETLKSLELTQRWELRSKDTCTNLVCGRTMKYQHLLYGVTHGGIFKNLRERSARFVDKHFNAIALGGAHKDKKTLFQVAQWTVANSTKEKPKHFLGIGEVEDLFESIERGIDTFDCVAITRRARNGSLYVSPNSEVYESLREYKNKNFALNIKMAKYAEDTSPIDPSCNCYTCQNFTRAYLRHLYMIGELLYHYLATYHNVYFVINLLKRIRETIGNKQFGLLKSRWIA